ncbi:hypothetical protein Agub_g1167 [Astrephomene gubernaculifera]|uniref:superoxide dismutase n=1 Tax=Astrephomene gubernaculifera TaxID=47775 RepID=A0AAD3DHM4_9CHLO|nr:hypothetical protein Agub_g1167 [Astrephomene gubernaculifera]
MAPIRLLVGCVLALQVFTAALALERGCPTGTGNNTYANPALSLPYDGYLPAIDNETMYLHHTRHAGGAINNVNAILARYPTLRDSVTLADLVSKIGLKGFTHKYKIADNDTTALRNNAGSMINHAIFWRIMTSYNTSSPAAHLQPDLSALINATWGSPAGMLDALRSSASSLFGSGWAWVVYRSNGSLAIVNTPNQDNPLMQRFAAPATHGTPLLGVDVWEHAYYLRYRNVRASYLAQWVYLVDWAVVQRNYELAKAGSIDSLYC